MTTLKRELNLYRDPGYREHDNTGTGNGSNQTKPFPISNRRLILEDNDRLKIMHPIIDLSVGLIS